MNNCDRLNSSVSSFSKYLAFVITTLIFSSNCTLVKSQQLDSTWQKDLAVTQAQILPDNTLGTESSQVRTNSGIDNQEIIEGGAQRQGNLFHSFSQFNIEAGQGAYFANPEGVTNIFSRVTGGDVSEIMGTLGVQGNADLFLLNPNGIVFGENSSLDLNGSFVGSSADSILFDNGFEFGADNPEAPPLLTVNMPLGLNLGNSPGAIVNNSIADDVGLQVLSGENISLIGGDISINRGIITAPGGTVSLGGLATTGSIAIAEADFDFPQQVTKANVSLTDGAVVDVTADGGGFINVNANNTVLRGSSALLTGIAEDGGSPNAQAGDINLDVRTLAASEESIIVNDTSGQGDSGLISIRASDTVELSRAGIFNDVNPSAQGNVKGIEIDTGSLSVEGGAVISSSSYGTGNAGNIDIDSDSLSIAASVLDTSNYESGNAGRIALSANNNITIENSLVYSLLGSSQEDSTNGGIEIDAESLFVTDNAELNTSLIDGGKGSAGNIVINANNTVTFDGGFARGRLEKGAEGNGGDILINTGSLLVTGVDELIANAKVGQLVTATFGQGNAGDVIINATGDVTLDGNGSDIYTLVASDEGIGDGGNIEINSSSLSINNQARLVASNENIGNAGNIFINTDSFSVANEGKLIINPSSTITEVDENAEGGNIEIDTKSFTATSGSLLTAATWGTEDAGDVTIKVSESALLDGASIKAIARGAGAAGNIELEIADSLVLRNGSRITTTGGSNNLRGGGGDININANQLEVANSLIDASTLSAENAGSITINAKESVRITGFGFARLQATTIAPALEDPEIINNLFSAEDINTFNPDIAQGIFAITSEQGEAGGIEINTPQLSVTDGSIIGTSSINEGEAGAIVINAPQLLEIDSSVVSVSTLGTGNAGDIEINTGKLSISNGGQITATTLDTGNGGNLTVKATELVELRGVFEASSPSSLSVGSQREEATGDGGSLEIFTPQLTVADGAVVAATTSAGEGGNIEIDVIDTVDVINSGTIAVNSTGQGNAGELNIKTDSFTLANSSQLSANTLNSEGGNIQLEIADLLLLRNNSSISTTAGMSGTGGNGGNIDIDAGFLVAFPLENSDIAANAFQGRGGVIEISTQGTFGIEEREQETSLSDITAISQQNPQLDGDVTIEIVESDLNSESIELPEEFIDLATLIVPACPRSNIGSSSAASEFVITGRGGLPPDPEENYRLSAIAIEDNSSQPQLTSQKIVEATRWMRNAKGKIELVA
ncbi:MAG: filamentous hemagglutinin N-terminal domain-containing protein, partial [Cyanobacteria bacterium P01_A01_bin.83]